MERKVVILARSKLDFWKYYAWPETYEKGAQ